MSDVTKVTVNLPNEVVAQLREIAANNHTTMTEAIRQSIVINKLLLDEERKDAKILIERPDGRFERIIRR